ncbi:MAG: hypothetical protein ACKOA2_10545 [Ilumatobacteraceae bacterium]
MSARQPAGAPAAAPPEPLAVVVGVRGSEEDGVAVDGAAVPVGALVVDDVVLGSDEVTSVGRVVVSTDPGPT